MPAIFPASTKGGGSTFGAPNVDMVPSPAGAPVPTPLISKSQVNQSKDTCPKVKGDGAEACTEKTKQSRSMGDESGVNKGMMSGFNMGEVGYKKGSSKVDASGSPWTYSPSMTGNNGVNANVPGAQIEKSQDKVIVSP